LPDEEDEEMRMMIPEQNNVSDVHELNWKELTRAVKSEDDPARILQLLHRLNESLQWKARELAEDLLENAA
jgi:hypothetical protein